MNGPQNRQFPDASNGFLQALAVARPNTPRLTVAQRSGVAYAEIVEIAPTIAKLLDGFYAIEAGRRRSAKRGLLFLFHPPAPPRRTHLRLHLFVPQSRF